MPAGQPPVKKKPKHQRKPLILGHVGSCWVMLTRTVKPLKAGLGHFGTGTSRNFLRNDRCTSQLDFFMKYTPAKYAFMVLTTIINHYITIINHYSSYSCLVIFFWWEAFMSRPVYQSVDLKMVDFRARRTGIWTIHEDPAF